MGYLGQTPYAKTWFDLGTGNAVRGNNDRYLHTGRVSAGCITQWSPQAGRPRTRISFQAGAAMTKRLALLLWFASGSGLLCAPPSAMGSGAVRSPNPSFSLDQSALSQPDTIAAWLKQHATTADRRTAQRYFEMGVSAQKQGNWSRAAKAFGESALFFPTPAALKGYGDSLLRDLASVRARNRDTTQSGADLSRSLAVYRSALAAEAQLKMLSAPALAQLRADESCLSEHLAKADATTTTAMTPARSADRPAPASECRPLALYGR
ncbi:MAG: hypothetical protein IPH26_12685 [Sterolibacteriaceae bacterium]|uniref:Tetratricopeptide repeat protein n=1 Tax=Candidatus Methylophosphatis roskildensis TaxID=2899263 RepID=A0A9D7DZF6_9PROT|nr:hypothetical protein [Candidatus Methylophosphatis roskildensis]MBK7236040.1 hypothetical protein [Sterolibacteriaceae bacterium]